MRKGKNGQADLDKGFKTGYFSFFNHQACVFYLCDMNYRAVQEKRKHLKYQGFLPWNKGRSIGQSKKTGSNTPTLVHMVAGMDLNHRPPGYEPDELPKLLYPAIWCRRPGSNRHGIPPTGF